MKNVLIEKFRARKATVGVIGLGYVGLPLAIRYAQIGFPVLGFDIDPFKAKKIAAGEPYFKHISGDSFKQAVAHGFKATTDFSRVNEVDALIICVPTPLKEHREPDISYITGTMDTIAPYMRAGQVVSLESTTYPGTTEEELRPRIEQAGFEIGADCFLVYAPEREDPGNAHFTTGTIPKLVSGSTASCLEVGMALYSGAIEQVVPVSSTRVAEMAKLLENIHRAVNIGLVNEMKVVADKMGINIYEVIEAAATKPFGFVPYYPGPGLGGHCIPIDPFYLTWKAREFGITTRFIELAGEINVAMPEYVVNKILLALNEKGISVKGSRVLILGFAYKKNIDDDRESPSYKIMELLLQYGAEVEFHDPYIESIGIKREYPQFTGKQRVSLETIDQFDITVILTDHSDYDYEAIVEQSRLVVDTRNACANIKSDKIIKA